MAGRYIVFEGIEGAGKSTVAEATAAWLRDQGLTVVTVREPGGTKIGEAVRELLLDSDGEMGAWTEALLFSAARAQLAHEVVAPALERGDWVVSDRSVYSSLAYQGGGRSLGIDAVLSVNEPGLGGVWPDLVVLLEIEPELGLARQDAPDRIGSEGVEFQGRVAEAFGLLARLEKDRFALVDASPDAAAVNELVRLAIMEKLL